MVPLNAFPIKLFFLFFSLLLIPGEQDKETFDPGKRHTERFIELF